MKNDNEQYQNQPSTSDLEKAGETIQSGKLASEVNATFKLVREHCGKGYGLIH